MRAVRGWRAKMHVQQLTLWLPRRVRHVLQLWRDVQTYYQGYQGWDLREFYDLESRLPYFDHAGWILGKHKRQMLVQWIAAQPFHGPILELGSGIGTFARQLAGQGHTVVGVDISAAKTAKGRGLSAGHFPAVQHFVGNLLQLGTGTQLDQDIQQAYHWPALPQFEVLLAADVLEHVPEAPGITLAHLRALLAPHGRLLVTVPSRLCLHDPGHVWKLLPEEWERMFATQGFHMQQKRMSRLCWYGLPTPLPLAMVYVLRLVTG